MEVRSILVHLGRKQLDIRRSVPELSALSPAPAQDRAAYRDSEARVAPRCR